jgi:hypothetical protein
VIFAPIGFFAWKLVSCVTIHVLLVIRQLQAVSFRDSFPWLGILYMLGKIPVFACLLGCWICIYLFVFPLNMKREFACSTLLMWIKLSETSNWSKKWFNWQHHNYGLAVKQFDGWSVLVIWESRNHSALLVYFYFCHTMWSCWIYMHFPRSWMMILTKLQAYELCNAVIILNSKLFIL